MPGRRGSRAPEVARWHPTLGRSGPAQARVIRGSVARGLRLRFECDLATTTRALTVRAVAFADVNGSVEVRAVGGGTSADRPGLRAGDRVVSFGADVVTNAADAERLMGGAAGDDVVMEVEREGVRRTVRFARGR